MNKTITNRSTVELAVVAASNRIVVDVSDKDGDGFTLVVMPNGITTFHPWLGGSPASVSQLFNQMQANREGLSHAPTPSH